MRNSEFVLSVLDIIRHSSFEHSSFTPMLIRTGDSVEVIAGNDRGQKSRVIKVDRTTGKALVEGVNRVKKHIRRSQKYPQGGVLSKEMPVQLSNLKYFCQSCGSPTRLGARFLE